MKSLRVIWIMAAILFQPDHAKSQARLNVKAADSLDFILTLDNNLVNQFPCLSITLDKLAAGKHNVKVMIPSHPEIVIDQVLTLKKSTSTFFEIEKNKGVYKLMMKSESSLPVSGNLALNQPVNSNFSNQQATNPSVDAKSAQQNASSVPVELNDSLQAGKCGIPADPIEYEAMISEVDKQFFETKKMDLMKSFLSQYCVRVEQLRFMMTKFTQEDNKIELLKASTNRVIDLENLKKVESDFFLEKNKARANQIIVENQ